MPAGKSKNIVVGIAFGAATGAALVCVLVSAGPAFAGSLTETAPIPVTATDWSTNAEVGQFNPTLGTLKSIGFGLTGTLQGSIAVENLEPLPETVNGGISSTVSLSAPGAGQVLSVSPSVGAGANLGGFDGKIDFAGGSGRTFSGLSNTQSASTAYVLGGSGPSLPTAPFIGTGKVGLPLTASANAGIFGPLSLAAQTHAVADAKVTVNYGYGAPASGGGSGGSFGADVTMTTPGFVGVFVETLGTQQTPVQTRILSDQNGDWTRNVSFAPFNPKLGELVGVNFGLSGDATATLSAQDTGQTAGSYSATQGVNFDLLGPGGVLDSTSATGTRSGTLTPFSGKDNFLKAFGTTTTDALTALESDIFDWSPSDPAMFSGAGPVTLAVEATGTLGADLPGSADLLSTALEGAEVTLSYTYLPSADPTVPSGSADGSAVPEPASFAVLLTAVAGFAPLRFRRRGRGNNSCCVAREQT